MDRCRVCQLHVGNVISASLRIDRDRFQLYYGLALKAFLWAFIPIYGWANCLSLLALISHLAFCEAIERPEAIVDARPQIESKKWDFLRVLCLTILAIASLLFISIAIAFTLAIFLKNTLSNNFLFLFLFTLVNLLVFIFCFLRIISYLFLTQSIILFEKKINSFSAIRKSCNSTNTFISKIQGIVLAYFFLSLPSFPTIYVIYGAIQLLGTFALIDANNLPIISLLILLPITLASFALILPLWQIVQAITYYDLQARFQELNLKK